MKRHIFLSILLFSMAIHNSNAGLFDDFIIVVNPAAGLLAKAAAKSARKKAEADQARAAAAAAEATRVAKIRSEISILDIQLNGNQSNKEMWLTIQDDNTKRLEKSEQKITELQIINKSFTSLLQNNQKLIGLKEEIRAYLEQSTLDLEQEELVAEIEEISDQYRDTHPEMITSLVQGINSLVIVEKNERKSILNLLAISLSHPSSPVLKMLSNMLKVEELTYNGFKVSGESYVKSLEDLDQKSETLKQKIQAKRAQL